MTTLGTLSPYAARFTGVLAIVGGTLQLASTVVSVTLEGGVNNGVTGGTITVWSAFVLAGAFVGLYRWAEPRYPRTTPWLTLVALTAMVAGGGFGHQAIHLGAFGPTDYLSNDAAIADNPIGLLAWVPWGWFAPLSYGLVGGVLARARLIPWWNGAVLIAGGVLFISARPAQVSWLALVCDVVLLAGLTAAGVRLIGAAREPRPAGARVAPAVRGV